MKNIEVELKLLELVMDAAVQIYVADIQKTPVNNLPRCRPLNKASADCYVTEALMIYGTALPRIRELINEA